MSTDTTARLFTIKEITTHEDADGRIFDDVSFLERGATMVLFTSEASALDWMAEQGYPTYQQLRDKHQATLTADFDDEHAQYAHDLSAYEEALRHYDSDRTTVQKLRAQGIPARVAPDPTTPVAPTTPSTTAPTISRWWYPKRHYQIVPATIIR